MPRDTNEHSLLGLVYALDCCRDVLATHAMGRAAGKKLGWSPESIDQCYPKLCWNCYVLSVADSVDALLITKDATMVNQLRESRSLLNKNDDYGFTMWPPSLVLSIQCSNPFENAEFKFAFDAERSTGNRHHQEFEAFLDKQERFICQGSKPFRSLISQCDELELRILGQGTELPGYGPSNPLLLQQCHVAPCQKWQCWGRESEMEVSIPDDLSLIRRQDSGGDDSGHLIDQEPKWPSQQMRQANIRIDGQYILARRVSTDFHGTHRSFDDDDDDSTLDSLETTPYGPKHTKDEHDEKAAASTKGTASRQLGDVLVTPDKAPGEGPFSTEKTLVNVSRASVMSVDGVEIESAAGGLSAAEETSMNISRISAMSEMNVSFDCIGGRLDDCICVEGGATPSPRREDSAGVVSPKYFGSKQEFEQCFDGQTAVQRDLLCAYTPCTTADSLMKEPAYRQTKIGVTDECLQETFFRKFDQNSFALVGPTIVGCATVNSVWDLTHTEVEELERVLKPLTKRVRNLKACKNAAGKAQERLRGGVKPAKDVAIKKVFELLKHKLQDFTSDGGITNGEATTPGMDKIATAYACLIGDKNMHKEVFCDLGSNTNTIPNFLANKFGMHAWGVESEEPRIIKGCKAYLKLFATNALVQPKVAYFLGDITQLPHLFHTTCVFAFDIAFSPNLVEHIYKIATITQSVQTLITSKPAEIPTLHEQLTDLGWVQKCQVQVNKALSQSSSNTFYFYQRQRDVPMERLEMTKQMSIMETRVEEIFRRCFEADDFSIVNHYTESLANAEANQDIRKTERSLSSVARFVCHCEAFQKCHGSCVVCEEVFQHCDDDVLQVRPSPIHGNGVFLQGKVKVRKGALVLLFKGTITTSPLVPTQGSVRLKNKVYIEPGYGMHQCVNHSCRPNCRFQKWRDRTGTKMSIVSNRTIRVGEELTVNYSGLVVGWESDCRCNCPKCK